MMQSKGGEHRHLFWSFPPTLGLELYTTTVRCGDVERGYLSDRLWAPAKQSRLGSCNRCRDWNC